MPTSLEWISKLPGELQIVFFLGFGIGAYFWARSGYSAGKKEPPVTSKDVVLTAAGLTDMQPMRDLVSEIRNQNIELRAQTIEQKRSADELGTIRQILAEDAENRQDYLQWRKGFEAGQRELPPRRTR